MLLDLPRIPPSSCSSTSLSLISNLVSSQIVLFLVILVWMSMCSNIPHTSLLIECEVMRGTYSATTAATTTEREESGRTFQSG